MCSIYGAFGRNLDYFVLNSIKHLASDRGRDGGRSQSYFLSSGDTLVLGNWRATPTTEVVHGELQPYDGLVHNGTIANDKELGSIVGEIDSQVLSRCLNRESVSTLANSLRSVRGSYAIATTNYETLFLACNYKPIHYIVSNRKHDFGTLYFSSMERHLQPAAEFGHRACALNPYTVLDCKTYQTKSLRDDTNKSAVVVCSAGLDSTVVAAKLIADGYDVCLLHFDYGCRATSKESALIPRLAARMNCKYQILRINYKDFFRDSLLDHDREIASGIAGAEFAHEWVPARNLVMISYAVAFAEAQGYSHVALGNNLEESGAYPDNEEQFTTLLDGCLDYAVADGSQVRLISPVGNLMKHEIVKLGFLCNAPFDLTWSCYKNGVSHCGDCGPCYMRREAFSRSGHKDPAFSS